MATDSAAPLHRSQRRSTALNREAHGVQVAAHRGGGHDDAVLVAQMPGHVGGRVSVSTADKSTDEGVAVVDGDVAVDDGHGGRRLDGGGGTREVVMLVGEQERVRRRCRWDLGGACGALFAALFARRRLFRELFALGSGHGHDVMMCRVLFSFHVTKTIRLVAEQSDPKIAKKKQLFSNRPR
jgi:hypothetical protein